MAIVVPRQNDLFQNNPFVNSFGSIADAFVANRQKQHQLGILNELLTQQNTMNGTGVGTALQGTTQPQISADNLAIEFVRKGGNPQLLGPILQALKSQEQQRRTQTGLAELAENPDDLKTRLLQLANLDDKTAGNAIDLLTKGDTLGFNRYKFDQEQRNPGLSEAGKELSKASAKFATDVNARATDAQNFQSTLDRAKTLINENQGPYKNGRWTNFNFGGDPAAQEIEAINGQIINYIASRTGGTQTDALRKSLENKYSLNLRNSPKTSKALISQIESLVQGDLLLAQISNDNLRLSNGIVSPSHESDVRQAYQRLMAMPANERGANIIQSLRPEQRQELADIRKGDQSLTDSTSPALQMAPDVLTALKSQDAPVAPANDLGGAIIASEREKAKDGGSSLLDTLINNPVSRGLALPAAEAGISFVTTIPDLPATAVNIGAMIGDSFTGDETPEQKDAIRQKADANFQQTLDRIEKYDDLPWYLRPFAQAGARDELESSGMTRQAAYREKGDPILPTVGGALRQGLNAATDDYFVPQNGVEGVLQKAGSLFGATQSFNTIRGTLPKTLKGWGLEGTKELAGATGSTLGEELLKNVPGGRLAGGLLGYLGGRGTASAVIDPGVAGKGLGLLSSKRTGQEAKDVKKFIATAETEGIPISAAQVTNNATAKLAENFGGKVFAHGPAEANAAATRNAFQGRINELLNNVTKETAGSAEVAGNEVVFRAQSIVDALKGNSNKLYNSVTDRLAGMDNFNFTPYETTRLINGLRKQFNKASGPSRSIIQSEIKTLDGILGGQNAGQFNAHWAMNHIKDLSDRAGQPSAIGEVKDLLLGIRGRLQSDLYRGAQQAGKTEIAKDLKLANETTALRKTLFSDSAAGRSLVNAEKPAGIMANFSSVGKIKHMRSALSRSPEGQEAFKLAAKEFLETKLGKTNRLGEYDLNNFAIVASDRKMQPIFQELMGSKDYTRLRNTADVAMRMKKINADLLNPSQTEQARQGINLWRQVLTSAYTAILSSGSGGAALSKVLGAGFGVGGVAGAATAASFVGAARIVQNPAFREAFTKTYNAVQNGNRLALIDFERLTMNAAKAAVAQERAAQDRKQRAA